MIRTSNFLLTTMLLSGTKALDVAPIIRFRAPVSTQAMPLYKWKRDYDRQAGLDEILEPDHRFGCWPR